MLANPKPKNHALFLIAFFANSSFAFNPSKIPASEASCCNMLLG